MLTFKSVTTNFYSVYHRIIRGGPACNPEPHVYHKRVKFHILEPPSTIILVNVTVFELPTD